METKNLEAYDHEFDRKVHFWGRLTIAVAFFVSFSIPFYLTFIAGYNVDTTVLTKGMVFVVGFVGIIYFNQSK